MAATYNKYDGYIYAELAKGRTKEDLSQEFMPKYVNAPYDSDEEEEIGDVLDRLDGWCSPHRKF